MLAAVNKIETANLSWYTNARLAKGGALANGNRGPELKKSNIKS
jgi:hypothetical protein